MAPTKRSSQRGKTHARNTLTKVSASKRVTFSPIISSIVVDPFSSPISIASGFNAIISTADNQLKTNSFQQQRPRYLHTSISFWTSLEKHPIWHMSNKVQAIERKLIFAKKSTCSSSSSSSRGMLVGIYTDGEPTGRKLSYN